MLQNAHDDTEGPKLTTLHCGSLILLGWFTNSVTWFRLGDGYRAYAYAEDTKGSFSSTMGTILAERVLDMALVFILLGVATLFLVATGVGTPWLFVGLAALMVVVMLGVLLEWVCFGLIWCDSCLHGSKRPITGFTKVQ